MQIRLVEQLQPAVLTAYFLTPETVADLSQHANVTGFDFTAAHAEKDAVNRYQTPERTVLLYGLGDSAAVQVEQLRVAIHQAVGTANELKAEQLQLVFWAGGSLPVSDYFAIALGETPLLSNYRFKKYQRDDKPNPLQEVLVHTNLPGADRLIAYGHKTAVGTNVARDLVNEPPNVIHPESLAARCQELGQEFGFETEVWNKAKLEAVGFGGLLAVNLGSFTPPTFTIMRYNHPKANNPQPIVLVGKGVTFDTGGLNLKPGSSMADMKADMGGAAAVIGAMVAIAGNQLPFQVIGLVPSTDNRPGNHAYTPNDVIKMYDGTQVEVLNTDAEGRMILADALAYAKELDPAVVIDLATLTGSAVVAVGTEASVVYSTAGETVTKQLHDAATHTFERVVQLPLWDDYRDQLKSDIADLKNVGSRNAGSITAAKFLQHFTGDAYPWVHLDIAGPSYLDGPSAYRPKGGTGVGVRLLAEFVRRFA